MAQNVTPQAWATALLKDLGIRPTPGALRAVVAWEAAEGGNWHNTAKYNPLNTTQPEPGAGNTGTQGNIKVYRSWQQGLKATEETLKNGRYGAIIQALKAGNPNAAADAIGNSPWGTSSDLIHRVVGSTGAQRSARTMLSAAGSGSEGPVSVQPGANRGSGSGTGGPTQATTAAVLQWLQNRHSGPGALLGLANAINTQPTPSVRIPSPTPAVSASGAPGGPVQATGSGVVSDPSGKRVAAWIEPILQYARAHGWQGTVSSGYRTDAEQTRIYDSGVRPAAVPKSEGGSGSNHEGSQFPLGAVDVTDPQVLANIIARSKYRGRLVYAGAKDPVHFSHPHGGGY